MSDFSISKKYEIKISQCLELSGNGAKWFRFFPYSSSDVTRERERERERVRERWGRGGEGKKGFMFDTTADMKLL